MKTLLVVAYLNIYGTPAVTTYEQPSLRECRQQATEIRNKVRAGTVRTWCAKVINTEVSR